MIGYIDPSALLRLVLRETGALDELISYEQLVSSELTAVKSCRTIDRLRLQGSLTTEEASVLSRASEPLPTPLGTLEAVHLATALIWRDRMGSALVMATHDSALGLAARTFG